MSVMSLRLDLGGGADACDDMADALASEWSPICVGRMLSPLDIS